MTAAGFFCCWNLGLELLLRAVCLVNHDPCLLPTAVATSLPTLSLLKKKKSFFPKNKILNPPPIPRPPSLNTFAAVLRACGTACVGMAPKTRKNQGDGVPLGISVFVLLLASRACRGRAVHTSVDPPGQHHQAVGFSGTINDEHTTAGASVAPASNASHMVGEKRGGEAAGVGVVDYSYSQIGDGAAEHDHYGSQQQRQALDLRACALGDTGVAEIARSPWVRGATAARVLSLRQNQVRSDEASSLLSAVHVDTGYIHHNMRESCAAAAGQEDQT